MWEILPEGLAKYVVCFLAHQQLLHRVHHRQEQTVRYGMVMQLYNSLSQQEEEGINRRFVETIDTLEIVPENNNAIEKG